MTAPRTFAAAVGTVTEPVGDDASMLQERERRVRGVARRRRAAVTVYVPGESVVAAAAVIVVDAGTGSTGGGGHGLGGRVVQHE